MWGVYIIYIFIFFSGLGEGIDIIPNQHFEASSPDTNRVYRCIPSYTPSITNLGRSTNADAYYGSPLLPYRRLLISIYENSQRRSLSSP